MCEFRSSQLKGWRRLIFRKTVKQIQNGKERRSSMSITNNIYKLFFQKHTFRTLLVKLIQVLSLGSYRFRVRIGAVPRPHYAYCVFSAAALAKQLGYPRISVIEFGVAGG